MTREAGMDAKRLSMSKTALITGGSRGIGKATADLLREQGWGVIAPPRNQLAFGYEWKNYGLFHLPIDRSGDALSAVIFCHGEWYSENIERQDHNDWMFQYSSRVVTPLLFLEKYLYELSNSRGAVVMVSSTRGFIGGMDTGPYAAACAAQIALMRGYAREHGSVRFNCVCPGLTNTDMGRQVIATGGAKPGAVGQPPGAVARVIIELVTDGVSSGRVVRVVDGVATDAKWTWE